MSVLTALSAVLLCVCGCYLTVKSGFFQVLHFKRVLSVTFGKLVKSRDFEGFKAMSIALGSTIGIGNIVGVTAAICIGGPGAVFWMLVTGILGMMTKFAETYISAEETLRSKRASGGPMYVMSTYFKGKFKHSGKIFAVATVLASLMAGNISQSKSVFEFSRLGFSFGALPVCIVVLPLVLIIILGKDKLYKNFSAVFVPIMSVMYVAALIIIILSNIRNVPVALALIFKSAFGIEQMAGGTAGALLAVTVRTGIMKGLFTNEAGMGSSPIAHCSAESLNPYVQGCWGIIEVFVDTVLVCMLTALAVLTSPVYLSTTLCEPFTLICEVFKGVFGNVGIKTLSLSAICFAFASIIGWSFYGLKALEFLTQNRYVKMLYIAVFVLLIPLSYIMTGKLMWELTDIFNSFMLLPNSVILLCFGGTAAKMLKRGENANDMHSLSEKMQGIKNRK